MLLRQQWRGGTETSIPQDRLLKWFANAVAEVRLRTMAQNLKEMRATARFRAPRRRWLAGSGDDQTYTSLITLPDSGWKEPRRPRTTKNPDAALRTLLRDKAVALVREKGVARTRDFAALGISRFYLCKLCAEGFLSRAGYGLYAAPKDAA